MSEKISRRELIQKSLFGFGALSLPVAFTGCNDGSDDETQKYKQIFFMVLQAVIHYKIKLFCGHVTPTDSVRLKVVWEISTDNQFKQN
jgi:alkaline phosphatase D